MAVQLPRSPDPQDPFRCLEDGTSELTQQWLQEQAAEAEAFFASLPARETLRQEFTKLYSGDTIGMPRVRKGSYFTAWRRGDQDMSVLYVRSGLRGEERVLLDPNTLSDDKSVSLVGWSPSDDGARLAYCLSATGNDKHDIRVKDVATGTDLPDVISAEVYPAFEGWHPDGTGFWYSKHDPRETMDEPKLHHRLYYHALGTDWEEDPLVFGEGFDKESLFGIDVSDDGRLMLVSAYGLDKELDKEWHELYLRDLSDPAGEFVCICPREPGVGMSGRLHRGRVYMTTQRDAPKERILDIDALAALAGSRDWKEVRPEGRGALQDLRLIGDCLFVETLENVRSVLRQYTLDGTYIRDIPLPLGTLCGFSGETEGTELFYAFTSFESPLKVYRLDLETHERTVFAEAQAGFDASLITSEQVWFTSKDGTRIPMFLIHRADYVRNGATPTVLYGYGGFNISLTPEFDKRIIPFVLRGGLYAIANLRGGGEFGKEWHDAGKQKLRHNVFDDFEAAARYLASAGHTNPGRLAIYGGSNGGLLTLTTVTQNVKRLAAPLVSAAVAMVPVADMLRYHLFDGGIHWIPDYGDPEDPEMREYQLTYSPYHNVVDGAKYPSVLICAGENDDRTHPMHARKTHARLKEANAGAAPILLRVQRKAGHGGSSAISKHVLMYADIWAYLFDRTGMAV